MKHTLQQQIHNKQLSYDVQTDPNISRLIYIQVWKNQELQKITLIICEKMHGGNIWGYIAYFVLITNDHYGVWSMISSRMATFSSICAPNVDPQSLIFTATARRSTACARDCVDHDDCIAFGFVAGKCDLLNCQVNDTCTGSESQKYFMSKVIC